MKLDRHTAELLRQALDALRLFEPEPWEAELILEDVLENHYEAALDE